MKHSLKRTGRKASYDLRNMLKSSKKLSKILTLKNNPSICTLKRVDEALCACIDKIRLRKTNRNNLSEFCGCSREILVRSNTKEAMQKGFITNGMIDTGCRLCPSFMNMIKTMPKTLSPKIIEIIDDFDLIK